MSGLANPALCQRIELAGEGRWFRLFADAIGGGRWVLLRLTDRVWARADGVADPEPILDVLLAPYPREPSRTVRWDRTRSGRKTKARRPGDVRGDRRWPGALGWRASAAVCARRCQRGASAMSP